MNSAEVHRKELNKLEQKTERLTRTVDYDLSAVQLCCCTEFEKNCKHSDNTLPMQHC